MDEKLPIGIVRTKSGNYAAHVTVNGRQKHIGTFPDPMTAELAKINYKSRPDSTDFYSLSKENIKVLSKHPYAIKLEKRK